MRQIFKLITKDNKQNEYNIVVNKTKECEEFSLYATDNKVWTEQTKNTELLTIISDGNGYKLKKKLKNINYGVAEELRILLNFCVKYDGEEEILSYKVKGNGFKFKI